VFARGQCCKTDHHHQGDYALRYVKRSGRWLASSSRTVSAEWSWQPPAPPALGYPTRIEVATGPFSVTIEAEALDYKRFLDAATSITRDTRWRSGTDLCRGWTFGNTDRKRPWRCRCYDRGRRWAISVPRVHHHQDDFRSIISAGCHPCYPARIPIGFVIASNACLLHRLMRLRRDHTYDGCELEARQTGSSRRRWGPR